MKGKMMLMMIMFKAKNFMKHKRLGIYKQNFNKN